MRSRAQLLFLLGGLASGCATTHVAAEWANPRFTAEPRKVLVVASVPTDAARNQIQESLAASLKERGIDAAPLNALVPSGKMPSEEEIDRLADEHGFDGVLVSRFIKSSTQIDDWPMSTYYGPGYGWYGYPYAYGYGGGYSVTEREILETNLFDSKEDGALLWTATSSTEASGAGGTVLSDKDIDKYADVIAKRLTGES